MRALLHVLILCAGLLAAGAAAAAEGVRNGSLTICGLGKGAPACAPAGASNTSLTEAPQFLLVREVAIEPEAIRPDRPIMVLLIAMAASEVRWNGELIGRNGRPGPDRAGEVPGRFVAEFVVPPDQVRPGRNLVTARLSSHHLPLPVVNAVHVLAVGDHRDSAPNGLMAYLPALLMIGVLAVAGIYFAAAAALDRGQKDSALLAAVAGLAVAQLTIEAARAFINYPYPWHVARVGAIAGLSAVTAVLIVAWAARRFAPRLGWVAPGVTAAAALSVLVWAPGYDGKAGYAVMAGFAAFAACAAWGVRRRLPGAWPALALGLAALAWAIVQGAQFLDRGYYLLLAGVFAALVAAQVLTLTRARAVGRAEAERAQALEETLARRDAMTATIRDGARTHLVPVADILMLQAADDYCDVRLADGRRLLSTAPLARTHAALPGDFVRVHKSFVVNAEHVRSIVRRPGGRRAVVLSDGSPAPVGRAYESALGRWTEESGPLANGPHVGGRLRTNSV